MPPSSLPIPRRRLIVPSILATTTCSHSRRASARCSSPVTGTCSTWPATCRSRRRARSSRRWKPRLDRDAGELFDRGQAGGDLGDAVVPEGAHAVLDRGALDLLAARVLRGERLQGLGHLEQLVDADPPLVAGLVAARAAALAVERHSVGRRR